MFKHCNRPEVDGFVCSALFAYEQSGIYNAFWSKGKIQSCGYLKPSSST